MSRKDHQAFADMFQQIQEETTPLCDGVVRSIIEGAADIFAADNPRFDRDSFLAACEVS